MGNNMEDLLLNFDDSSSVESDDERVEEVPAPKAFEAQASKARPSLASPRAHTGSPVHDHQHRAQTGGQNTNESLQKTQRQPQQRQSQDVPQSTIRGPPSTKNSGPGRSMERAKVGSTRAKLSDSDRVKLYMKFVGRLVEYIKRTNTKLYNRAKFIVQECAQRKRRGDHKYASPLLCLHTMDSRLRKVIPPNYWNTVKKSLQQESRKKASKSSRTESGRDSQVRNPTKATVNSPESKTSTQANDYGASENASVQTGVLKRGNTAQRRTTTTDDRRIRFAPSESQEAQGTELVATGGARSFPRPRWGATNIVTDHEARQIVQRCDRRLERMTPPDFSPPTPAREPPTTAARYTTQLVNPIATERDEIAAAISEGAQAYIQSILKEAATSARLRLKLDEVRIWMEEEVTVSTASYLETAPESLDCDAPRQEVATEANAATNIKPTEEVYAPAAEPVVPSRIRGIDQSVLEVAKSWSDVLFDEAEGSASLLVDDDGRGTRAQHEPAVAGRKPKSARLGVGDIHVGMQQALSPGQYRSARLPGVFAC